MCDGHEYVYNVFKMCPEEARQCHREDNCFLCIYLMVIPSSSFFFMPCTAYDDVRLQYSLAVMPCTAYDDVRLQYSLAVMPCTAYDDVGLQYWLAIMPCTAYDDVRLQYSLAVFKNTPD